MSDLVQLVGTEFLVNSATTNHQRYPAITSLANGNFVVTWNDSSGSLGDTLDITIKAQLLDAAGAKIGGEFLVNTETDMRQAFPTITALVNGGFVVSWTDTSGTLGDTSGTSIKAQVFDATGARIGDEFLVNTQTASNQSDPSITGLGNGGFVVAWHDYSATLGDTSNSSIKAQLFDAKGLEVGGEFLVNTQTASYQWYPATTGLANGGFVVTWFDRSGTLGDESYGSVKAQVFDASGVKVGDEFLVNTQTYLNQESADITALDNGGFVVAWNDSSGTLGDASPDSIKAQVFDASGAKVGGELLVNSQTVYDQQYPTITSLDNGGFVVTWQDYSGTLGDASGDSIKAQVFDATGTKVGGEFLVNTQTAADQSTPTIANLDNGGFVVTWFDRSGTLGDTSGDSIKAQIFAPSPGFAPSDITLSNAAIDEAISTGVTVGTLSAADRDVNDNHAFSLIDDPSGGAFAIVGNELRVVDAGKLDFETEPELMLRIRATDLDGNTVDKNLGIAVRDIVEGITAVKLGGEFLVSMQTASGQHSPSITGLANGGFVVTWHSGYGTPGDANDYSVTAQVFDAAGLEVGEEFLVNTQTEGYQWYPASAGLSNGGFVVTWTDYSSTLGDTSFSSVKAQVFNASGVKLGEEFLVNTQTEYSQGSSTITGLASGGFVVTWIDDSSTLGDASGTSIKAQVFAASGAKVGEEFLVNTQTANDQRNPTIAPLDNGGFVVAWNDGAGTYFDTGLESLGISAQVFDASGAKVGAQIQVYTLAADYAYTPAIAGLGNGGFVVTWHDESSESWWDSSANNIRAQVFDAIGVKLGGELVINTQTAGYQTEPAVSGLENGGFVVSWKDRGGTLGDASETSIKAQVFDESGTKVGGEFLVNSETESGQETPALAELNNGGFAVGWQDSSGTLGGTNYGSIKAQVFGVPIDTVDGIDLGDVGESIDSAAAASIDGLITGATGFDTDTGDYYSFTPTANGLWSASLYGLGANLDVELRSANGGLLASSALAGTRSEYLQHNVTSGTAYYVHVLPNGTAECNYALELGLVAEEVVGTSAADVIDLRGSSGGRARGLAGNDIYIVDGLSDVVIENAGEGVDTIQASHSWTLGVNLEHLRLTGASAVNGTGNALANRITGNAAGNVLKGGTGADTLVGGSGVDKLFGGAGNDQLTGGVGSDRFVFGASLSAAVNVDRVHDFVPGADKIALDDDVFTQFTAGIGVRGTQFYASATATAALDADDRLIYNTTSGALYYDADGTGSASTAIKFAVLGVSAHPTLTAGDFVVIG